MLIYAHVHETIYTDVIHSFHNQLKTVHLNGKVNRRVDFLVNHLLEYEKDAFFHYKSARQLPPAMNKKAKEQSRHQRGLQIPTNMVKVIYTTHVYTCACLSHNSSINM